MQVSGDGDAEYFSILVERSLLGSRLFKYAIGAVVLMIGISLGIVGWEISTVGDLTAQVDAKLHEARRILDEKQSAMDSQIANATRLGKEIQRDAELVEEEKERARRELNRLRGDVEGVQATLEKMRSELRGVRGAWDAEKAGWDKELAQIQGFFDEQKAEVRKAVTSTIGELAPLLVTARAKEAEVDGLARQASASAAAAAADAGNASAQSEAAQTHASKAQSEGEQVERLRERVDSIHTGLNAKVAAAESAAAAALESVDRLTRRLDGKRQDFENALASGVELEERLNRELQGIGAAIDAWRKRTEDAVVQVEEQAAEASATLRERSAEPLSVLQGRRDRAKEIVEGLVRRESDARVYLGRLEEIQSKARDQYEATADASSEVSALLRHSEGQRAVLAALFGQVDDRR
jgi:chromosome segregation ATPase